VECLPGRPALRGAQFLITVLSRTPSGPMPMPCGEFENLLETAAFGCPAARAAVVTAAGRFNAEMTNRSSRCAQGRPKIVALWATDSRRRLSPQKPLARPRRLRNVRRPSLQFHQPVRRLRKDGELGKISPYHRDFIAAVESRTSVAVLVDLVGQVLALRD